MKKNCPEGPWLEFKHRLENYSHVLTFYRRSDMSFNYSNSFIDDLLGVSDCGAAPFETKWAPTLELQHLGATLTVVPERQAAELDIKHQCAGILLVLS